MIWYFNGVYIINRTLHGISLLVLKKYFTRSRNIFQHTKRNFISLHGHVISSIYQKSKQIATDSNYLKCQAVL